jgi:hypothetical protein
MSHNAETGDPISEVDKEIMEQINATRSGK